MHKDIVIFIIGLLVIIKSADLFTSGAEGVAHAFKIPRMVIGVTIVSMATTTPELTVSTISSYMGAGGLALGNAVGSCICNIGLILALAAIIRPIQFEPKVIKQELLFFIFAAFVLYFISLKGMINFYNGLFLISLLAIFFTFIVLREIKRKKKPEEVSETAHNLKKDVLMFALGAIGVVVAAKYAIIPSGINIARYLNVSELVIGLTMVALGTSLPELFTCVIASAKNMGELAVGNVIGANILNILWVVSLSAMIRPLSIDIQTITVTFPVMISISILLLIFARTRFRLTRAEGLLILAIYAGYIFYLFK